jgi:hypothetical protein
VPGLRVVASTAPEYRLRLTVKATDTNVLTGPRVARNKETFTLLVVSEEYLRRQIALETDKLAEKLKKVQDQLKAGRSRLEEVGSRLRQLKPGGPREEFEPVGARAQTIEETLVGARGTSAEVLDVCARLLRELQLNRVSASVIETMEKSVVGELDAAVRGDFPAAEAAQRKLRAALDAAQVPSAADAEEALRTQSEVIDRLSRVLEAMGKIASVRELLSALTQIRDKAREAATILERIKEQAGDDVLGEALKPSKLSAAPVSVAKGQKVTVTVQFDKATPTTLKLTLTPAAGSDLKVPPEVSVPVRAKQATFEVNSGSQTGDFIIKVTPSKGSPIEVKVVVK